MPCIAINNLHNNLVRWTATVSLRSAYQGSIDITDPELAFDESYLWSPIQLQLISTVKVSPAETGGCYAGTIVWMYGVVIGIDISRQISERLSKFTVASFPSRLARKPVNTRQYGAGDTIKEVLTEIASKFGALPDSLYSFADTSVTISGVVSGSNMLDAMKEIARCAGQELFVSRSGVLKTEAWKTEASSVDYDIPSSAIESASRVRNIESNVSRYKVRGAYFDKATVQIDPADTGGGTGGGGGGGKGRPSLGSTCVSVGAPSKKVDVKLGNLRGNPSAIVAGIVGGGVRSNIPVLPGDAPLDDNTVIVPVEPASGFWDALDDEIQVTLQGFLQSDLTEQVHTRELTDDIIEEARAIDGMRENIGRLPVMGGIAMPVFTLDKKKAEQQAADVRADLKDFVVQPTKASGKGGHRHGGGGGYGKGGHSKGGRSSTKAPDESEEMRIEVTVDDAALQDEFGVITGEISNIYANTEAICEALALRAFKEIKMGRKKWSVTCRYLACLDVNKVVRFTPPNEASSIVGLLTEINLNVTPEPNAVMSLVIESFEDL